MKEYYSMIEPIITRPTDINKACLDILFRRYSNLKRGIKVLDVSCGRGYLSAELAKRNPHAEIFGCDINIPDSVRNLETTNLHFVEGNAIKLPFQDDYFDIVISAHTLEHIVEAKKAYEELRRVCKKRLIIIVPCQREYHYTMDFHVQFFPYTHSLLQFTGNYKAMCKKIDNDLFYEENVTL